MNKNQLKGIFLVFIFSIAATCIADIDLFSKLGISPLIVGIILGMIYANTFRKHIPTQWQAGVVFCTKTILRIAIVFYGFRLTFQSIYDVGISGVLASILIVVLTFIIGYVVGVKFLKMDRDLTLLTTAGSSICGAAAVMATQPVLKASSEKSAVAVGTVVLFGTIAMFLYPFIYKLGLFPFNENQMGIYIGATIHEVAHVVGAGNALGAQISDDAIIVKMTRVLLLAPTLLALAFFIKIGGDKKEKTKVSVPLFAIFFVVIVIFNSVVTLPKEIIQIINTIDGFALTMAMTALGMESNYQKFKQSGIKPLILAFILFLWLIFGGIIIVNIV